MGIEAATPEFARWFPMRHVFQTPIIGTLAFNTVLGPLHCFATQLDAEYRSVPLKACGEPIAVQCHAQMLELPRELVFAFALKWPQWLAERSVVLGPPLFPAPVRPVHTVQIDRGPRAGSEDKAATEGGVVN